MHAQVSAPRDSTLVAWGVGVIIKVVRRHLAIEDRVGRHRRHRRVHPTSKLRRLVVICQSGYVSFDALRLLHDIGAAFVHLHPNGELIACSVANGPDLAGLRRAQALAADGPAGLEIARHVLALKLDGQRALLDELPGKDKAAEPIEWALSQIEAADNLEVLLAAEAKAAAAYWKAWAPLPVRFQSRERARWPDHWRTHGPRASRITGSPRTATNPCNAARNYLLAIAEAETVIACRVAGLDSGLGIFHLDRRDRHSMALDLLESIRPAIDAFLHEMLTRRVMSARDFVETREGGCRITPKLAEQLAETCTVWRSHIAPVVEWTANTLAKHATSRVPTRSPLTHTHHRAAWNERKPDRRQRRRRAEFARLPDTCRDCGAPLPDRRRRYCNECSTRRFADQGPAARERAGEVLAQLRSEQQDPAHGRRAAETRGRKNAAHQAAIREWQGERPDPERFRTEILPSLRRKPIGELAAATGLSEHYCSLIRLGKTVPHARHWEAFAQTARGM